MDGEGPGGDGHHGLGPMWLGGALPNFFFSPCPSRPPVAAASRPAHPSRPVHAPGPGLDHAGVALMHLPFFFVFEEIMELNLK